MKNSSSPYLSVIIPAYNERKNFSRGDLPAIYAYLKKRSYSFEMILANDGSTDTTSNLLHEFAQDKPEVRVLDLPHQGKGPTVQAGMLAAQGENRLFTDFDQSTPIQEIEKLLPFRKKGYDVIIGSREVKGSTREKEPWYRHLMGKVFNMVVQIFAVSGIHDTQCGFKLFSAKATDQLFPRLSVTVSPKKDSFTGAFDVELLFLASKMKLMIAEVPIQWHHRETVRVNPLKDSVRMFFDVIRIRASNLFKSYEA